MNDDEIKKPQEITTEDAPGFMAVDNFGWQPTVRTGADDGTDRTVRVLQGALLKFTGGTEASDGSGLWTWTVDGESVNGRLLMSYDKSFYIVRWDPYETRPVTRETPADALEKLNAAIPQSEWPIGTYTKKPEAPYQLQRVVEFIDPQTLECFSWAHSVTIAGSSRAASDLENRIERTRRVHGDGVYPLVTLEATHMSTAYGGRKRPHLEVVGWVRRGMSGGIERVAPPTLAEEINDEIVF